jgi:hypothetical protein
MSESEDSRSGAKHASATGFLIICLINNQCGKIIVGKMIYEFKAPRRRGRRGAEQLSCGQPQEDFFIRKAGRQE